MLFPPNKYQIIADNINSAQSRGDAMITLTETMEVNWANSEVDDDNIDKIFVSNSIINNRDLLSRKHVSVSNKLLTFIIELQKQASAGFDDINSYLSANSIIVGQTFADLSEDVGFSINSSNIRS
jgi:hypothetical protein